MAFRNHNTNTLNSVGGENSSWRAVGSTKSNIPKVLPVHSKENELPSLNGKQGAPNNVDHEFTSLHRMNQYGQPRAQNQQYQHGTLENSIKSPPRWSSDERICSVGAFGSLNRHSDHPPMFAVNRRDEPLKYADTKGEPFSVGSYRGWKTGASGGNINVPRTESIVSNSFIRQDPSSGELAIYSSQEVGYATTAIKNFSISESEKTTVGTNSVKQFGTDKIPSSRGYAVPPGFTSYSAAARSFLPAPPKTKVPTPAFEIYKEYRSESTQRPDIFHEDPQTLEQYSRELHALSERCDRDSAQQAEFLLRRIIYNYKNGIHAVQPDGGCYNSVIHAFAKVGMPHQAENVMRLMFSDFKNGNESAEPNVRCFTNVLHAWRKSNDPEAPERCEGLIEQMREISIISNLPQCKPDTFAITVLLQCWVESNRDDAAECAEAHFRDMKARFLSGDEAMRPDCISYSILLNTYAQTMQIEDTERLLWEMVEDFCLNGNMAAEPRTRNFNTVLAMFSRCKKPDSPDRAESVFKRFIDFCNKGALSNKPDEYTYSLLLKTWITSGRSDNLEKAVDRLDWMRTLSNAGDDAALPDVVKYTTVISGFAQSGDSENAASLLNQMVEDYMVSKNKRVKPDYQLFDLVIKACTGAYHVAASDAFRAESVMRQMWSLHSSGLFSARPQSNTYKHVIIGYKKAGVPQRAEDLLWEMESKSVGKPDKHIFQTVLNAWHASRHPDKQKHLNSLRLSMKYRFDRQADSFGEGLKKS